MTLAADAQKRPIGREEIIRKLRSNLDAGQNVFITGPRGIGVTTVIHEALSRSSDPAVVCVPLAEVATDVELATRLSRETFGRMLRLPISREAALADLMGEQMYEALRRDDWSGDPLAAFRLPQLLARFRDDRPLILAIDDCEELTNPRRPYGDPDRVAWRLRETLQDSPLVTSVIGGVTTQRLADTPKRAFHGWGVQMSVPPLTRFEWQEGIMINNPAAHAIWEYSHGHTATMVALATLTQTIAGDRSVTRTDALAACDRIVSDRAGIYAQLVVQLRRSDTLGLVIARRVAQAEALYSGIRSRGMVGRALESLELAGIIDRQSGHWMVTDPVFAEYLRRLGPGPIHLHEV